MNCRNALKRGYIEHARRPLDGTVLSYLPSSPCECLLLSMSTRTLSSFLSQWRVLRAPLPVYNTVFALFAFSVSVQLMDRSLSALGSPVLYPPVSEETQECLGPREAAASKRIVAVRVVPEVGTSYRRRRRGTPQGTRRQCRRQHLQAVSKHLVMRPEQHHRLNRDNTARTHTMPFR